MEQPGPEWKIGITRLIAERVAVAPPKAQFPCGFSSIDDMITPIKSGAD
jgi:hypothetical protein